MYLLKNKKLITFIALGIIVVLISVIGLVYGLGELEIIFNFVIAQVLGMKWLNFVIGLGLTVLFGKEFLESRWGGSVQFFVYDTIKIIILLCTLIFIISYIQSYFPPERTRKIIGRFKGITANIMGALLGTLTPFCSCSSIPLFIGFTKASIPTGVTFSFLISSPLVDLGAFILLTSIFGINVAITYVLVGLILAVIGGAIIEKSGYGKYVEDYILQDSSKVINVDITLTKVDRLSYAKSQVKFVFKKVYIYILIGVGIGAIIHNWIPIEWIQAVLGSNNPFSVFIATVIGVPIYADIFGTIPVAEALFLKGVGIGTILAFMMSVTTLSVPSLIMLRKAVKPKLLLMFIAVVVVGILIIGFTFNWLNFIFV